MMTSLRALAVAVVDLVRIERNRLRARWHLRKAKTDGASIDD